jgi:beta-glucanase (GH16 family)
MKSKNTNLVTLLIIAVPLVLAGCKKFNGNGDSKSNGNGNNGNGGTTNTGKYTNPNTATAVCDADMVDTALTNHGWTKTFDEEFSGSLSGWQVMHGGMYKELECNDPSNVQIVNGVLQITAKKGAITGPKTVGSDTSANFDYSSGWLVCNTPFVANSSTPKVRVVARIKMASGYGLTNLFYSYGSGVWPTAGEIDFAETQGDNTKVYATDYAYGPSKNVNNVSGGLLYNPTTEDLSACYHVYTMEWTQNSLNSYLDGKLVEAKTSGGYIPSLFGKPQYLSLSLPIGGLYYSNINTANIQGGTLYVDWVKVFTSN